MSTAWLGALIIGTGILHEGLIYWLQRDFRIYSRWFGSWAFAVHAIQLGGTWLLLGGSLGYFLLQLSPTLRWHQALTLHIAGYFLFCAGILIMLWGLHDLGWQRMMKSRLFAHQEPPWIKSGIYHWLSDPMYRGSQIAMSGLSLLLASWPILLYVVEMIILQQWLIWLERNNSADEISS